MWVGLLIGIYVERVGCNVDVISIGVCWCVCEGCWC